MYSRLNDFNSKQTRKNSSNYMGSSNYGGFNSIQKSIIPQRIGTGVISVQIMGVLIIESPMDYIK